MANPHIKIKHFTGGPNGKDLTVLHFQKTSSNSDHFHLYQDKEQIHTEPDVLTSGRDFTFRHFELNWSVTKFWISEKEEKGHGHWQSKPGNGEADPESGTFQAQSGGTGMEGELKVKASTAQK